MKLFDSHCDACKFYITSTGIPFLLSQDMKTNFMHLISFKISQWLRKVGINVTMSA